MDVVKKHRSHVSSKKVNSRGWTRGFDPLFIREVKKRNRAIAKRGQK